MWCFTGNVSQKRAAKIKSRTVDDFKCYCQKSRTQGMDIWNWIDLPTCTRRGCLLMVHMLSDICSVTIPCDTVYAYNKYLYNTERYMVSCYVSCWWPTWQGSFFLFLLGQSVPDWTKNQFSLLSHTLKSAAKPSNAIKCLCSGNTPLHSLQPNQLCINKYK